MTNPRAQIQKLLRLSKSSNPNEAAAALKKAHALMEKYGYTDIHEYSRQWQQDVVLLIEKYHLGEDSYILIERLIEVAEESGYSDNSFYQQGLLQGIERCLKEQFPDRDTEIKNTEVTEVIIDDDEEYHRLSDIELRGSVIGDGITFDFLRGDDITKNDYSLDD